MPSRATSSAVLLALLVPAAWAALPVVADHGGEHEERVISDPPPASASHEAYYCPDGRAIAAGESCPEGFYMRRSVQYYCAEDYRPVKSTDECREGVHAKHDRAWFCNDATRVDDPWSSCRDGRYVHEAKRCPDGSAPAADGTCPASVECGAPTSASEPPREEPCPSPEQDPCHDARARYARESEQLDLHQKGEWEAYRRESATLTREEAARKETAISQHQADEREDLRAGHERALHECRQASAQPAPSQPCPATTAPASDDGSAKAASDACAQPVYDEPAHPSCPTPRDGFADFESAVRLRREAFEHEMRRTYDAFAAANHTDEEWARFKGAMEERRLAFEHEMRAAFEAWAAKQPNARGDCAPPPEAVVATPGVAPCRAVGSEFSYFVALMEEERLKFARLMEERRASFHEGLKARHAAGENASALRAAEARFEDEFTRARAEFETGLQKRWAEYQASAGGCAPVDAPPVVVARAAIDDHRLRCELELRAVRAERVERAAYERHHAADGPAMGANTEPAPAPDAGASVAAAQAAEAGLQAERAGCEKAVRAEWERQHGDELRTRPPEERMGSFVATEDGGRMRVSGKYVSFTGDPTTQIMSDHAIQGQLCLAAVASNSWLEDFRPEESAEGTVLVMRGEGLEMRFFDNPTGVVQFRTGDDVAVKLTFADYVELRPGANAVRVTCADDEGWLRWSGDGVRVEGQTVLVRGKATYFFPADNMVLPSVANRHRELLGRAAAEGRLGAEVTIVEAATGTANDAILYSDVEVAVTEADAEAGRVALSVSSETHDGRTIALNLADAFARDDVEVAVVDDETRRRVEATRASSLADVLDPTDDDGPEYWLVSDEDGWQVLLSISGFSTTHFEIQSVESAPSGRGVPAPGAALVLVAAIGAACTLVRRRW